MKAATIAAKNLVRQGHVVKAIPKLTAEWEHNRFSIFDDPSVTVTPEVTPDLEWNDVYDLFAIVRPNQPRTGIAKARFDPNGKLVAAGKYRDIPQSSRFYFSTPDDSYKYWSSQQKTGLVNNGGNYEFDDPIVITVNYAEPVVTNKIVAGFEMSYARPTSYSIEVSETGDSWYTVPVLPPIDNDGRISVCRMETGGWTDEKLLLTPDQLAALPLVKAVRISVYAMNKPYSHLDVLQLGARIEIDLSGYVENYQRDFEVSDRSAIAPLGVASSNTAGVSLNNMDGLFNDENEISPLYGLMGKKVKFTMDLSYDATPMGGQADERIREFTMWTDSWGGGDQMSVAVTLKDSSVFLQENPVPQVFWGAGPNDLPGTQTTTMSVGSVIWQIMDVLGLSNYQYSRDALDNGLNIPYYWPEPDSMAWEEISALAEGTQTAVYFDEYDILQIKPRNAIFNKKETIDWNLDAINAGSKLADIVELEQNDELLANDVKITYSPTKYTDFNNGFPKMETVWEPEDDTMTIRASHLTRDFFIGHDSFWIRYNEVAFWPYEGLVNIRGENVRYKGKEYYVHATNNFHTRIITTAEEKQKADQDSDPNLAWKNSFSGKLMVEQRGVGGTAPSNHYIRPSNYDVKVTNYWNTAFYPMPVNYGMNWFDGVLTLIPPPRQGPHDYMLCQHETAVPSQNATYGMRFMFPEDQMQGDKWATGGLFFGGDWGDAGWYLEISPTQTITDHEKRTWRHEISLYGMRGNQPIFQAWGEGHADNKGFQADIKRDVWYDLDVHHEVMPDGWAHITVYLNGVFAGFWRATPAFRSGWADQGKFGVFTRWLCKMNVEYLYAVNNNKQGYQSYSAPKPDASTFMDLQRGGFTSGYIEREWRYGYLV